MTAQETADRIAFLAASRILALVRLSTATHVYDPTPGTATPTRHEQRYRDLDRFMTDERVIGSVIDPGLLPIAKGISRAVLGQRILTTRRIAAKKNDQGSFAHVVGYGIRIGIRRDEEDTVVAWECLCGVT